VHGPAPERSASDRCSPCLRKVPLYNDEGGRGAIHRDAANREVIRRLRS
jgi:hypothetical protein